MKLLLKSSIREIYRKVFTRSLRFLHHFHPSWSCSVATSSRTGREHQLRNLSQFLVRDSSLLIHGRQRRRQKCQEPFGDRSWVANNAVSVEVPCGNRYLELVARSRAIRNIDNSKFNSAIGPLLNRSIENEGFETTLAGKQDPIFTRAAVEHTEGRFRLFGFRGHRRSHAATIAITASRLITTGTASLSPVARRYARTSSSSLAVKTVLCMMFSISPQVSGMYSFITRRSR